MLQRWSQIQQRLRLSCNLLYLKLSCDYATVQRCQQLAGMMQARVEEGCCPLCCDHGDHDPHCWPHSFSPFPHVHLAPHSGTQQPAGSVAKEWQRAVTTAQCWGTLTLRWRTHQPACQPHILCKAPGALHPHHGRDTEKRRPGGGCQLALSAAVSRSGAAGWSAATAAGAPPLTACAPVVVAVVEWRLCCLVQAAPQHLHCELSAGAAPRCDCEAGLESVHLHWWLEVQGEAPLPLLASVWGGGEQEE